MASQSTDGGDLPARRPAGPVAPATQVRAHLECIAGPEKDQTFRLTPGVTTIGRDPANEVVLSETVVSRQHARIERRDDEWVLVNLSANGTRVNKQQVDEAVLTDGAEIRVGAKTRLVFFLEQVAISPTGRPQFRARTGRSEDRVSVEEETEGEPEGPESWFQRRRGLVIGLGAYIGVMVIAGLALTVYRLSGGGGETSRDIPILRLEDVIEYRGETFRIDREASDGVWVTDPWDNPRKIPREAFQAGQARGIRGIKNAIIKEYEFETNRFRAEELKKRALDLYGRRQAEPENLFLAVRRFQQALAYGGGRSYFPEPVVERIRKDAEEQLIETIHREYNNAVLTERSGDLRGAQDAYERILRMIPERDNHIVRNVNRRLGALRKRIAAQKG